VAQQGSVPVEAWPGHKRHLSDHSSKTGMPVKKTLKRKGGNSVKGGRIVAKKGDGGGLQKKKELGGKKATALHV